jgi:hypothetical protein
MNLTPELADPALEVNVLAVEEHLANLGDALIARDTRGIEAHSTALHRSLARAVDHFTLAAKSGAVPLALRRRLAAAGGQVAAQREALARATAALDRAIEVLMPRETPALYSAYGSPTRSFRGGSVQA